MSTYAPFSPSHSVEYVCPVCYADDTSTNPDTIAHSGLGRLHPLHKECARAWLESQERCPTCNSQIDIRTLFSWKERCVVELKNVALDALKGATFATLGGMAGGGIIKTALGGS